MAREPRCRHVERLPSVNYFKPRGIPAASLQEIILKVEELEAVRLKDLLGWEQEECAARMQVSRPTFQRILIEGRAKIADALVNGKAILIEGGDYCLAGGHCRREQRRNRATSECPYLNPAYLLENEPAPKTLGGSIAVCSKGHFPSSQVDGRFGRCSCFMIWNPETTSYIALENGSNTFKQGAGTGAAYELINEGVEILIASQVGPKAFSVLKKAGIQIYEAANDISVETAVQKYNDAELKPIEAANKNEMEE